MQWTTNVIHWGCLFFPSDILQAICTECVFFLRMCTHFRYLCVCVSCWKQREQGHPHRSPLSANVALRARRVQVLLFFFWGKGSNVLIICSPLSKLFVSIWVVSVHISIFCTTLTPVCEHRHTPHTCSAESSQTPASSRLPRSAHTSLTASAPSPLSCFLISI